MIFYNSRSFWIHYDTKVQSICYLLTYIFILKYLVFNIMQKVSQNSEKKLNNY